MTIQSPTKAMAKLSIADGDQQQPPPSQQQPPPASRGVADDELERFRQEWRQEVQTRREGGRAVSSGVDVGPVLWKEVEKQEKDKGKGMSKGKGKETEQAASGSSPATASKDSSGSTAAPLGTSPHAARSPLSPGTFTARLPQSLSPKRGTVGLALGDLGTASESAASSSKIPFRAPQFRKDQDYAIKLYTHAVELEQTGQLNDALQMYRRAFKADENVDRLYQRMMAKRAAEVSAAEAEAESATPSSADVVDPSAPAEQPYNFRRHIQVSPDYERTHAEPAPPNVSESPTSSRKAPTSVVSDSRLTAMFNDLAVPVSSSQFLQDDESLPTPIALLPPELVDPVFSYLDVGSIERFGLTCWRARYLTANASAWRRLAEVIYRPPMVPRGLKLRELVDERHRGEWRSAVVEEERIRMDGCYISVCHYIRPGAGEQWINITHMITYHRFLRFFPDGTVISYLTTDHPSEVVPHLAQGLRGKGLHFGRWRLVRHDDDSYDEERDGDSRAHRRPASRVLVTDLLEPGTEAPKYEFEMELTLRETGRGRWNKLDLATYSSIHLGTGEVLGLSLKHQKPFYFSKVRSYNPKF